MGAIVGTDLAGPLIGFVGVIVGGVLLASLAFFGERRSWRRGQHLAAYTESIEAIRDVLRGLDDLALRHVDLVNVREDFDREKSVFLTVAKVELLGSRRVMHRANDLNEYVTKNVREMLQSGSRITELDKYEREDFPEALDLLHLLNLFIIDARSDLGRRRRPLLREFEYPSTLNPTEGSYTERVDRRLRHGTSNLRH